MGEEVNTELGHGMDKRKSWRLPGNSKRGQQDEMGQQLSKNTRGRIENKSVMGSESGRHWFFVFCFIPEVLSHPQANRARRILLSAGRCSLLTTAVPYREGEVNRQSVLGKVQGELSKEGSGLLVHNGRGAIESPQEPRAWLDWCQNRS